MQTIGKIHGNLLKVYYDNEKIGNPEVGDTGNILLTVQSNVSPWARDSSPSKREVS